MLTTISNNSMVTGYQGQQISAPQEVVSPATASEDRRTESDKVEISREARSLQDVYDRKKRTLEERYANEAQQLEREYRQEKKRLESDYKQKTQSLGINTYV